jgi:hypothetical protein
LRYIYLRYIYLRYIYLHHLKISCHLTRHFGL